MSGRAMWLWGCRKRSFARWSAPQQQAPALKGGAGALSAAPGCGALSREQAAESADASARMKIDLIMFNLTFSTRSVARAGPLHAGCDYR
jgi:hypothetical protein